MMKFTKLCNLTLCVHAIFISKTLIQLYICIISLNKEAENQLLLLLHSEFHNTGLLVLRCNIVVYIKSFASKENGNNSFILTVFISCSRLDK